MHPRLFLRTAFAASLVICGVLLTVLPTATAQMPESMGASSTTAPGAPGSAAPAGDPNAGQNSPDQTNNGAPLPSGVENSSSAFGQASTAQSGVQRGLAAAGQIAAAPASLQISLGDLLEITVFDTPELSSRLRVNNHGDILIPLAGTVHVQGLTAPEAAQAIAKKMVDAELILAPQVTVFIAEYATQGVTMAGEIRSPGVYPLLGPRTLLDMVTMAGGLGDSASKTISIIHRSDPSKVVTVRMNVSIQTPESFAAESYPIQPGDTIFVARSGIVYVVGDLKTPGGYQVEHNDRLTLLDAVALAGGPTTTSKLWDARLIRRTEHGREELVVDLKKIMYGQGPDMLLQDGDILFVPISQRKVYTAQAISAVIGAATQYALYLENR
jgi:polysaccharide export outer membrane protein